MSEDLPSLRTDALPPRQRPRRRKPAKQVWVITALSVLAAAGIVAFAVSRGPRAPASGDSSAAPAPPRTGRLSEQSEPAEADPTADTSASESRTATDSSASSVKEPAEQIVDDPTGTLLWTAPTAGPPISVAFMPAGVQCLVHLRPALIAAHPEGEKVLAALGPWGQEAAAELKQLTAADLAEIDALLVGIIPRRDGRYDACLRVVFAKPRNADELAHRFPAAKAATHGAHAYRVEGERAWFLTDDNRMLVVSPAAMVADVLDAAGDAPPLTRDLAQLVEHSDADRAVTLIVAPKFLHAGGSKLLVDAAAPLRDALQLLVGNDATAVALSAHWDDANFFAEVRAVPALNVPPRTLAVKLRQRIEAAPDAIEEQILAAPWHPYGRKVLARFPAMLRKLAGYARHGDEDRLALVRAYLPPVAGHNLLMGAELLLTQPHGEGPAPAVAATPAKAATLEERLAAATSLAFTKESLEQALELLSRDVGVPIEIAGGDLQLDGITKNQSLGLDLRDRPAAEILLEILLRANPDRTAAGPTDPKQKLVYVVRAATADSPGRIIVTTRTAAEKRGEPLPSVFVGAQP